jgi:hypothetical protein
LKVNPDGYLFFRKKTLTSVQLVGVFCISVFVMVLTSILYTSAFYISSHDPQNMRQYEAVLLKDGDLWTTIDGNGDLKFPTILGAHSVRSLKL